MASRRGSADVESDSFEAYLNMTLREAAKMLAAEHQRLMQLRHHQSRGAPTESEESPERKRARAMVARRSNESSASHDGLGIWNRMGASSQGGSRSFEPRLSADRSRSQLRDPNRLSDVSALNEDMWKELQGQITPSRGSLASVHSTGIRASVQSVESVLVRVNQCMPSGNGDAGTAESLGPRISVIGADQTSLHNVHSSQPVEVWSPVAEESSGAKATNSRLSVQSLSMGAACSVTSDVSCEADTAPKKKMSQRLSDVSKSAMAWISGTESASSSSRSSVSKPTSLSPSSARNSHSGGLPRSNLKTGANAPNKGSGFLNRLTGPAKSSTPARQVSFMQSNEEVDAPGAASMESSAEQVVKPPQQVEPLPPPPVGQLVAHEKEPSSAAPDVTDIIEAKQAANDLVVPIPADDVKTLVVECTEESQSKDRFNMRSPSPTFTACRSDVSFTSVQVPRQTAALDPPEDSLMARVARQTKQSEFQFQSPMPSASMLVNSTASLAKGRRSTAVEDVRFPMLEIWDEKRVSTIGARSPMTRGLGHMSSDDILKEVDEYEESKYEEVQYTHCVTRAILIPNSKRRMIWDMLASVLVAYECIMIPLQFIGMAPSCVDSLAWIVRIFWTFDMPLTFLTGYVLSDGTHEMRLHKVAGRYLSTWFIVDLVVLVTDWAEVFLDDMSYAGAARAGKTAKTLRLLRMARIARLFKFKKIKTPDVVEVLMETIFSPELLPVIFNLFKIVLIFAWMNHVMACLWYSIGEAEYGAMDWIKGHEMSHMPKEYIYLSAYHWSLQQFAGAAEVWPWNMEERTFAVIFGVITFVAAGAFVSSLTSSMTHFEIINSQDSKRLTQLKHFLFDSGISHAVAMRVQRNAKHALKEEKRNMPESSIELLPKLSEPLRMEIHYDMHMPLLASHPFFRLYNEISPFMMRNVCHNACLDLKLSAGDLLFCEGEVPKDPHVFFVKHGCMNYRHHSGSKENAGPGKWASEAGVWCTWIHCGSMVALEECTLLVLVAPQFQSVCSHFLKEIEYARQYGKGFLKHLNDAHESELTDLEDPEMDIEWLAMQTCPNFRQTGLVGRLMRRSSRNTPGQALRRSSTMNVIRRGLSSNGLMMKASVSGDNGEGSRAVQKKDFQRSRSMSGMIPSFSQR